MRDHFSLTAALVAVLAFLALTTLFLGLYQLGSLASTRRRLLFLLRFIWQPAMLGPALHRPVSSSGRRDKILEQLSRLSLPEEGWQDDGLRLKFIRSGLDFDQYGKTYFATRTVLTLVVPLIAYAVYARVSPEPNLQMGMTLVVLLACAGYYGPERLLRHFAEKRRSQMQMALPDVLDLLVICTESGMSLDQAIARVANEIARNSPVAAREFQLVSLSVRAGMPRSTAFRNLAQRTELDDLASFATMVIQAERFGTGIASSLRSQSELMRVRRMQRAEEAAAKLPTKLLIPLVLFVFPSLFIVILGPALMSMNAMLGD
jgi:tight adherence protein C